MQIFKHLMITVVLTSVYSKPSAKKRANEFLSRSASRQIEPTRETVQELLKDMDMETADLNEACGIVSNGDYIWCKPQYECSTLDYPGKCQIPRQQVYEISSEELEFFDEFNSYD